jgi:hypothetical protein
MPEHLQFNQHPIRQDGELINLLDLWKATKLPPDRRPYIWRQRRDVRGGLEKLFRTLYPQSPDYESAQSLAFRITRGNFGGTWAQPLVAAAYARSLGPDVYRWVVASFFEPPPPKESPSTSKELRRLVSARGLAVGARFPGKIHADVNNALYLPLFGTAEEYRQKHNLPLKTNVRQALSPHELELLDKAEELALSRLRKSPTFGYLPLLQLLYTAASDVAANPHKFFGSPQSRRS